jgi:iron complex outermembrane recepter protein
MFYRAILFFLIYSLFFSVDLYAQCNLSFSGHINDAETKEHLSDAVVTIKDLKLSQTANTKGEFVFKGLCPGYYTVIITHASCIAVEYHFHLKTDIEKDFNLLYQQRLLTQALCAGRDVA